MNITVSANNTVSQNEFNLVKLLQSTLNSGITILKANNTFTDWQKLNYDNNTQTIINNPCN